MRVLHLIHGPVFGGAHNQLLQLAEPLAARGFDSVAVLPEDARTAARRLGRSGIEVVTIPIGRVRATANPLRHARTAFGLWPDVQRVRQLIRDRDVDVVQVHGPTNPHGALAARSTGRAVVWQLLDTRAPMAVRRLTMPIVVRLADAISVWGNGLIRLHPGADRFAGEVIVVFPPVDRERFAPDAGGRERARKRLGVAPDSIVVGSVGVLNPQKGHEFFLRAAGRVTARHPGASFRILGSSSAVHADYEAKLRSEATRLGLTPELTFSDPGTDVPELLQAFDLFAMAPVARSEGMPTAILEAMAAGKPVIATRVGAVDELVEDEVTGALVEPEDVEQFAAALDRLLSDRSLRERMGAAGRDRAEASFDIERLADLHSRAYLAAVEWARSRGRRPRPSTRA